MENYTPGKEKLGCRAACALPGSIIYRVDKQQCPTLQYGEAEIQSQFCMKSFFLQDGADCLLAFFFPPLLKE